MPGHYERLSFLDNSFLALESRTTHMHVASLAVFDRTGVEEGEGIDIGRLRRFIGSRLSYIPRYRQHLAYVPVERHPVWVDDEHFSLDYHVRHTALPHPGTHDQLTALTSRIVSQQLDRSKPLWELWFVEGLEDNRFAIISKVHHCMIDGLSGIELMTVLLAPGPTHDIPESEPWTPRPAPSGTELALRETVRRTARFAGALASVGALAEQAQDLVSEATRRTRAMGHSLSSGWLTPAPRTPLNGRVGPNRRFETLELPLSQVKDVKNALGGTVNDVVIATVAGAVRSFLTDERGYDCDRVEFRVMVPVSVRDARSSASLGNHVAMWLLTLPVGEPDPVARLRLVGAETDRLKETEQAFGAATIVQLSSGAPATLVSLASRLATSARPFNMTVTNVPGPQFPMYMLEARLLHTYPLVPLWESHGLGIALFSYDGEVAWGLNADLDIIPDLPVFGDHVRRAFAELRDAAAS